MYKLVALDIDGTIYNPDQEISKEVYETIKKSRKMGVKFVLISGRGPKDIASVARKLDLKENSIIGGLNGSIVKIASKEDCLLNTTLETEDVLSCLALTKNMDFPAFVYIEDDIFVESNDDEFVKLQNKFSYEKTIEVGDLKEFLINKDLLGKVNKIGIANEYDVLLNFKKKFLDGNNKKGQLLFSLPFYIELIHENVSKGHALKYVADKLNISKEAIIAIGDGENDIDMLNYAGLGIAMGNAFENVKETSDFVTLSNKEDGVAYALNRFIIKK